MSPTILTLSYLLSLSIFLPSIHGVPLVGPAISSIPSPDILNTNIQGQKNIIVQLFEWNWDSVAKECKEFIGPAGYGYVQVSPPAEHVAGGQWWTDYQPVSYKIISKRGNREQFASMVGACHSAGVKVIADTLFNHMSAQESGTGVGGSSFSHYDYPDIYSNNDFHHCGKHPGDDIVNYNDRQEVQTCELVNLADLATDTEYVRGRLADYARDLLSLGVDGFRLDAAKHIPTEDIKNILSRVPGTYYVTQEVISQPDEPIQAKEYVDNGDVQEFQYTYAIKAAFENGDIANLQNLDNRGWLPSNRANVFVANHDTERYGDSLNIGSPSNAYVLATIFSLAHPYGKPTVLSSFGGFGDKDKGAPNGGTGACEGFGGKNGWFCQHRWIAIAGIAGFRNTVGDAGIENWVAPQNGRIAFGRGSAGFVAINNEDTEWKMTFTTSLPNGRYCDVISGSVNSGSCSGASLEVSSGKFDAVVAPRSATAIHIGAQASGGDRKGGVVEVLGVLIRHIGGYDNLRTED